MWLPHQRDGLGEIADIIVRELEQDGIRALGDERPDHSGFRVPESERAGECCQGVSALWIGRGAQVLRHQPQLIVAAGFIGKPIQQLGETLHDDLSRSPSAAASSPTASSASSSSP